MLERPRTNSKDSFYYLASELIGGSATPESVRGVVDLLNGGRHIVHGIKDYGKLEIIDRKGVLPLTPEGGHVSFWLTGLRVFGTLTSSGHLQTRDSSFFDYAHCRLGVKPAYPTMLLALSNQDLLMKNGLDVQIGRDSQVTIDQRVPRECITLLEVRAKDGQVDSGKDVANCERAMFGLIKNVLNKQYSGGEHILKTI